MLGTEDTATTGDGDRTVAAPIGGPITLGFPARPEPVRLARLVSAAVAGSVDATIDDIEDLRIAVGEACAILVGHASPTGRVDITIEAGPDAIGFQAALVGGTRPDPQVDDLAQMVLESLADDVELRVDDAGARLSFRWPVVSAGAVGAGGG
ncbi:MAG: ATP-binding protein [Microthrixaceae bacterium]|nr:ATP-binding protein [Microthrixaceae bacterium]